MPIVGTAGHVDHGKSTLIAAITGRDPDRWAQEKERGLTIDLGFAWTRIGDRDVSFVDVPGHERFLKNMLAGVDPIDVALFVVAADEGWAAQSEEHLAILDLLGIAPGVVALTKVDRVETDLVGLAALEVEEKLVGTCLEGARIVPVSAATGSGMADLLEELDRLLAGLGPAVAGPPTLWIDRVFAAPGAGTIVTGSLSGGPVARGDLLELQPGGHLSRVRSIQSHEATRADVGPGARVALGVPDIPRRAAIRGSVLTPPGVRKPTSLLLCDVRPARGETPDSLTRGAFHLHLGAGDWPVTVRPLDDRTVIVRVTGEVPAVCGDRFVLRDAGRRAVVGGGRVLDPRPDPRSRAGLRAAAILRPTLDRGANAVADALLEIRGVASAADLMAWSGGGRASHGTDVGGILLADTRLRSLVQRTSDLVRQHLAAFPLRDGLPKAQLASSLDVPIEVVDVVIASSPDLAAGGSTVATTDHRPSLDPAHAAEWKLVREVLERAGFAPPRGTEVVSDEELRHLLLRTGDLTAVGEFLYLPATLDGLRGILADLDQPFTVTQAKDALGISRKHAVPLMEWCDEAGITRRSGAVRTIR